MPIPIAQLLRIIAPAIPLQFRERKVAGTHAVGGLHHVVYMSFGLSNFT